MNTVGIEGATSDEDHSLTRAYSATPLPVPARSGSAAGLMLVLMAAMLWGTGGVSGALVASHSAMSWEAISALRLLLGGVIMLVVTWLSGELARAPRSRAAYLHIALTAALTSLSAGAYFLSVGIVGVSTSTVVALGTAPIAVAVATAIHSRSFPAPMVVGALVAAVIGLVLVADAPIADGLETMQVVRGCLLALLSGLAFAATTVLNRRAVPGLTPAVLIALSFTLAGVMSAAWAAVAGFPFASMSAPAWLALACSVAFHGVIGYLAFYAGLHRGVPATTAAIASLSEACTATLLSVVVLQEQLTEGAAVGMTLIMLAVLLVRPSGPYPADPDMEVPEDVQLDATQQAR